jgi:hypothetical protein
VSVLDLILDLESRLKIKYNRYIQVANEYSMDDKMTPFKDVKTLEYYLKDLINHDN